MFIFSGKSRSCSGTFATCIAASKEYLTRRQIIFIYLESTFYHLCYRKVFFKLVNFPRVVQENKIRCIIYYETNTLYAVVTTAWSRNERQKDSDRRSTENVLKQKSSNINKIKKQQKTTSRCSYEEHIGTRHPLALMFTRYSKMQLSCIPHKPIQQSHYVLPAVYTQLFIAYITTVSSCTRR